MYKIRYSKSGEERSVEKTAELFKRMKSMHEAGNKDARPNLYSYVTLINCVVKSGEAGAAERAEGFLFEMYKQYKDGDVAVKPNTKLVTTVIDSWQKTGGPNAGERAEFLLNWLIAVNEKDSDEETRPNECSFSSGKATGKINWRTGISTNAPSLVLNSNCSLGTYP